MSTLLACVLTAGPWDGVVPVLVPWDWEEASWTAFGSAVAVLEGMPPTVSEVIPACEPVSPEFVDILVGLVLLLWSVA